VGFEVLAGTSERVSEQQPLIRIHARSEDDARRAVGRLESALPLSDLQPAPPGPPVWKRAVAR